MGTMLRDEASKPFCNPLLLLLVSGLPSYEQIPRGPAALADFHLPGRIHLETIPCCPCRLILSPPTTVSFAQIAWSAWPARNHPGNHNRPHNEQQKRSGCFYRTFERIAPQRAALRSCRALPAWTPQRKRSTLRVVDKTAVLVECLCALPILACLRLEPGS